MQDTQKYQKSRLIPILYNDVAATVSLGLTSRPPTRNSLAECRRSNVEVRGRAVVVNAWKLCHILAISSASRKLRYGARISGGTVIEKTGRCRTLRGIGTSHWWLCGNDNCTDCWLPPSCEGLQRILEHDDCIRVLHDLVDFSSHGMNCCEVDLWMCRNLLARK